jgi:hypothetical protein
MALSRPRIDRSKVPLTRVGSGQLLHIAPGWKFEIRCKSSGDRQHFDFSEFRLEGRDELASNLRDAIWSRRFEATVETIDSQVGLMRAFFRYLNARRESAPDVQSLRDIDRSVVDGYLLWLSQQQVSRGKRKGRGWVESSQASHYAALKSFLKNRVRWVPGATNPNLNFPSNPFPNLEGRRSKPPPYSDSESKRILSAINKDLRSIHGASNSDALRPRMVLAAHFLAIGFGSGRNTQSVMELKRDCLRKHTAPGRETLVTEKRRGYSEHATSIETAGDVPQDLASIPTHLGDHIRWLSSYTEKLSSDADAADRGLIFIRVMTQGPNEGKVRRLGINCVSAMLIEFSRRHKLVDDRGDPLVPNLSRARKTFGADIFKRSGGSPIAVKKALNHTNLRTTNRSYLDISPETETHHALVLTDMHAWASVRVKGKVLIAADGQVPLANVKDLLAGGYNTGVARCRNPFREDESVCAKFFTCFRCQNMVVFEDDLWRLFSFYYRLLAERSKIAPQHWMKTFAPIIKRIDSDIAPQFPLATVEAARARAMNSPHPTWSSSPA